MADDLDDDTVFNVIEEEEDDINKIPRMNGKIENLLDIEKFRHYDNQDSKVIIDERNTLACNAREKEDSRNAIYREHDRAT